MEFMPDEAMKYRNRISKILRRNTCQVKGRFIPATLTQSLRVNNDIHKSQVMVMPTTTTSVQTTVSQMKLKHSFSQTAGVETKDAETSTVSPDEVIRTMSFPQVKHYLDLLQDREGEFFVSESRSSIRPSFQELIDLEAKVNEAHVQLTEQGLF